MHRLYFLQVIFLVKYRIKREKSFNEKIGYYTSYGVEVYAEDGKTLIKYIDDVFLSLEKAEKFVALCNENDVELCHLEQLCEDFII